MSFPVSYDPLYLGIKAALRYIQLHNQTRAFFILKDSLIRTAKPDTERFHKLSQTGEFIGTYTPDSPLNDVLDDAYAVANTRTCPHCQGSGQTLQRRSA